MNPNLSDTPSEVEKLQIELIRQMPPWKRLYLAGQMIQTVRLLNLSGLRRRYPEASVAELKRRLADLWLGPKLAARVYGPLPEDKSEENQYLA
ncbi:MAG: hypothetical protein A2Z16_01260 [Chloroflexi bacterium RBG_16_54_18]|nr:MAG: hypothetical protein A2Z16_01260 [Chloroflexi bacterium RBG_16_54_18]